MLRITENNLRFDQVRLVLMQILFYAQGLKKSRARESERQRLRQREKERDRVRDGEREKKR